LQHEQISIDFGPLHGVCAEEVVRHPSDPGNVSDERERQPALTPEGTRSSINLNPLTCYLASKKSRRRPDHSGDAYLVVGHLGGASSIGAKLSLNQDCHRSVDYGQPGSIESGKGVGSERRRPATEDCFGHFRRGNV
jgi:hypothetical protein